MIDETCKGRREVCKNLGKNGHTKNCCNDPKIWTMWFYNTVMCPKHADELASSVDHDQTALLGDVWSGSTLFILPCLSENLGSLGHLSSGFWREYRKNPKNLDTRKICCNFPKILTMWLYPLSNGSKRCRWNSKQCRLWSDCSSRSSLIWVYTVCPDLSVRKLRIITVIEFLKICIHKCVFFDWKLELEHELETELQKIWAMRMQYYHLAES